MRPLALLVGGTAAFAAIATTIVPTGGADAAAARKPSPSPYAYSGLSFGTRVMGGKVPVDSGRTALVTVGCQNRTGISRTNNVAAVKLPGLGTVNGVQSAVWTSRVKNSYAVTSTHKIAGITLAQSALGTLSLKAITLKRSPSRSNSATAALRRL